MVLTEYVLADFVDQFRSTGNIDIAASELSKNDRLKSKLRIGISINSERRVEIYKKIILDNKPLIDGEYVKEDNSANNALQKSPVFDTSLFTAKWLNERGIAARNNVLKQILEDLPEIKYAPLLPMAAAVLLMYFNINQTYYLLSQLLKNSVIARTKSEAFADDNALRDLALLRLKSPTIRKYLSDQNVELKWRKWVLHLNLQLMVNFFDVLFYEGAKVKFRFGLAYLNLLSKLGLPFDSYLDQGAQAKLMPKAFGIKRFKWATCSKLINRHKILLDMKQGGLSSRLSDAEFDEFIEMAKNANSKIIKIPNFARIIALLPPRFTVQKMQKVFSTQENGYTLSSVYQKTRGYTDILMLIQPKKNNLIGCFMSSIDSTKSGNSGTGESFVFQISETVDSWFWNEDNPSIFTVFAKDSLTVGNGAIFLDSDLSKCSSSSSETFSSPNLLTKNNSSCPFEVQTLEVFAFVQEELSES